VMMMLGERGGGKGLKLGFRFELRRFWVRWWRWRYTFVVEEVVVVGLRRRR